MSEDDSLLGDVLREDGGMSDAKGRFRCLVDDCGWKRSNLFRASAIFHVKKEHPHLKPRIVRAKKRARAEREEVPVVIDQDDGGFRCRECGWTSPSGTILATVYGHGRSSHGKPTTLRAAKPTEQERIEAKRAWDQAYLRQKQEKLQHLVSESPAPHPLSISDANTVTPVQAAVLKRQGVLREVRGRFEESGQQSLHVAISLAALNAASLRRYLGQDPGLPLFSSATTLTISFSGSEKRKGGSSAGACGALALACLLGRCPVKSDKIAVTGSIDLRGVIGRVGGINEKVTNAFDKRLDLLIIPAGDMHELDREGWSPELAAWAERSLKSARNLIELMEYTIDGFRGRPDMVKALGGPHVGLGPSMGMLAVDGTYAYEVQCARVAPGSCDLLMTGGLSEASVDAIHDVVEMVARDTRKIARACAVPLSSLKPLCRRGRSLHVHLEHAWQDVLGSYQRLVIYVSLVSLQLRRRPRADAFTFASIDSATGQLTAENEWLVTKEMVQFSGRLGWRLLVIAPSVVLQDEAKQLAEEAHGKANMEAQTVAGGKEMH